MWKSVINLITHYLWKSVLEPPQNDLNGRMPERSEWLLAGGVAKRNPRYRDDHHYASERRENRLPRRLLSRLSDAFLYGACIPGVALSLNPRLRALGLRPRHSTFQVGYLCRGVIKNTDYHKHDTDKHIIMKIRA